MNVLNDKEQGKIPISIGTSLALEGLFGTHDEFKGSAKDWPILSCECLSINLRTMVRNLLGALNKEIRYKCHIDEYTATIFEEMNVIRSAVEMKAVKAVKIQFYVSLYKNLEGYFKYCRFKQMTTPNQQLHAQTEERICQAVIAKINEYNSSSALVLNHLEVFDLYPVLPDKKVYLISHIPLDLLLCQGYRDLLLLESHTGAVKSKAMWYTKLKGGSKLYMIPFDKAMVQMFGDSGDVISPIDHRFKAVTLKIAEQYKWNALTTKDRILATVGMAHEPILLDAIKRMYG